jgi:hypothetical protein
MTAVQTTARLGERTVQAIARGDVTPIRTPHPRGYRRSSPVAVLRVHPAVMATARRLAHGDMTRIEIHSETEVVVR